MIVVEIWANRFIDEHIGIDQEKCVDALRASKIPQGKIFLMAEENPRVLVVREIFVGEELGKLLRLLEVVFVSVMFDPEVKAIAAVAEQDKATVRVRAPRLGNRVG